MSRSSSVDNRVPGPESIISDALFSIIIFIYVAVTFLYVFYAFCFNSNPKKASIDALGPCERGINKNKTGNTFNQYHPMRSKTNIN